MNVATAKIIAFILSITGLSIAVFYMLSKSKEQYNSLVYLGLCLLLASIILRNLVRFKPEWFKDKPTRDELDRENN
jgi:uncharacterized protein YybS (DUF2232 family)